MYAIKREIVEANLTGDAKLKYRKIHAIPLHEVMKDWLQKEYNAATINGHCKNILKHIQTIIQNN